VASVVLVFSTDKPSVSFFSPLLVADGAGLKFKTPEAAKAGAAAAAEITGTDQAALRTSVRRLGPRLPLVTDSDALVSLFTVLPQKGGVMARTYRRFAASMSALPALPGLAPAARI